jgi:S1-C subfamily serine protease
MLEARRGWMTLAAALICSVSLTTALAGLEDLVVEEEGEGAFLGVHIGGTSRDRGPGALIVHVLAGSAAEAAGLRPADILIAFDGQTTASWTELLAQVEARRPGDRIAFTVLRDGVEQTHEAELGRRESRMKLELDDEYFIKSPRMRGRVRGTIHFDPDEMESVYLCEGDACRFETAEPLWYRLDCLGGRCPQYHVDFWGRPMLGVHLVPVTKELREHLGSDGQTGILVGKVLAGSPAEQAGILVGDLIIAVDAEPVGDDHAIGRQIRDKAGKTVEVEVLRDGRAITLDAYLPEIVRD